MHVITFFAGISLNNLCASTTSPALVYASIIELHETVCFAGILSKIILADAVLPILAYPETMILKDVRFF